LEFLGNKLDDRPIVRAALHEAAHVVVGHAFHLPIRDVWIDESGNGKVNYTRRFHYAEIETWIVATLAGGIVERERWGSAADGGDLKAIDAIRMRCSICRL
jgi:hypothetical protein